MSTDAALLSWLSSVRRINWNEPLYHLQFSGDDEEGVVLWKLVAPASDQKCQNACSGDQLRFQQIGVESLEPVPGPISAGMAPAFLTVQASPEYLSHFLPKDSVTTIRRLRELGSSAGPFPETSIPPGMNRKRQFAVTLDDIAQARIDSEYDHLKIHSAPECGSLLEWNESFSALHHLEIETDIADDRLVNLVDGLALRSLKINSPSIRGECLERLLEKRSQMETISLCSRSLDEERVASALRGHRLVSLGLMSCQEQMTALLVEALPASLESLDLSYTGIVGIHLCEHSLSSRIVSLSLNGLSGADSFVDAYDGSHRLEFLSLMHSDLTDHGLECLAKWPKLRWVDLVGAPLSADCINSVRQSRKNVRWNY